MKKEPLVFVKHIRDFCDDISRYMAGISKEAFLKDKLIQDAVIRKLEIIGEAVKNLPADFRKKYQDVPWIDIAGLRDKVIHDYFGVDLDLVFSITQRQLSALQERIIEIIKREEGKSP